MTRHKNVILPESLTYLSVGNYRSGNKTTNIFPVNCKISTIHYGWKRGKVDVIMPFIPACVVSITFGKFY